MKNTNTKPKKINSNPICLCKRCSEESHPSWYCPKHGVVEKTPNGYKKFHIYQEENEE